jgi:protease I
VTRRLSGQADPTYRWEIIMTGLLGKRVAILATDGVERVELELPRGALYGAGAATDLLSLHTGEIQARQFDLISAGTLAVDRQVSYASAADYDALLLPGGTVNPDTLRTDRDAVEFVKACVSAGMPIAAICHGPWALLEANAVQDRRMTSWPSLRTDLRCAGAVWVDEEVVIDGQLTTSRSPADLPAFCAAVVEQFARDRQGTSH